MKRLGGTAPSRHRGSGRLRAVAAGLLAVWASSCAGGGGTDPEPGGAERIEIVSGDQQTGYLGNAVTEPYEVLVTDGRGRPVGGVSVAWRVVAGAGSIEPAAMATSGNGRASAVHTLGMDAAVQQVTATIAERPAVTFTATAVEPPSEAQVRVGNNFFQAADVVVRAGGSVTWEWDSGGVLHNVTYSGGPEPLPEDSPTQGSGRHENHFPEVGRYDYVCTLHAGMEGSVTVVH